MFKKIWQALKSFEAMGTHGPTPHGLKAGLKRVPTHLVLYGVPSLLVCAAIPPGPWKWIPAAAMVAQGVRGEFQDVKEGEDTWRKALLDLASQSGLAILGALI